jgi:hypothetical protein
MGNWCTGGEGKTGLDSGGITSFDIRSGFDDVAFDDLEAWERREAEKEEAASDPSIEP